MQYLDLAESAGRERQQSFCGCTIRALPQMSKRWRRKNWTVS